MKQLLLFIAALLMLPALLLTGCKKDAAVKIPSGNDSTVTTLATGAYYYVTPDNNGNFYALGYNGTVIYKYNAQSGKTAFYTLPQIMDHDTVVVTKLACLTTDSLGNVYTVSFNNAGLTNVLEITPSGSASTIFTNIDVNYGNQIQYIATYNGTFYFSDNTGIYKIAPAGSPQFLVNSSSGSDFAIDRNGNLIYSIYAYANNSGEYSLGQINPQGVKSVLVSSLYNTGTSTAFGIDIITDKFGDIYTYITNNNFTLLKINSAGKISTISSGAIGDVDGPLATAEIGGAFNMVADQSGNLYFSQGNGNLTVFDVRKITF